MKPEPRHLILNLLLGAAGRQLAAREAIAACALFGIRENSVRVALARLSAAGLVETFGRGEYRLGPGAARLADEVATWRDAERRVRDWNGAWIAAHVGDLGRSNRAALRARGRALGMLGLRELDRGLFLRPDNLAGGVEAARERLLKLGLESDAAVFVAHGFDAARERRAAALWDGRALTRGYRETRARLEDWLARAGPPALGLAPRQRQGLAAFMSRMHWHCHFIQKLESEPELEWRNLHRGYDGLREDDWNPAHFEALQTGRTGWPMVDACVAMLRATGWLNFRMRAMLVSVAAYPLWLHWRPVGLWLARQFLDYEPGIHWSQMQMQAGTTGINTTRVYNPIKQAQDHDPEGVFVRRWQPHLRHVPDAWLLEPWRMPADVQARCGVQLGRDLPEPLVDLAAATRAAKARVHALRAQAPVREAKAAIVEKHGSRLLRRGSKGHVPSAPDPQQSLEF